MQPIQPLTPPDLPREAPTLEAMRSDEFRPKRSIWPGLLIAGVLAAGVTAVVVTMGDDDGAPVVSAVAPAATATAPEAASPAAADAAITAAVKTALAADPALAAVKIDVTTRQGAVLLEGPAPDEGSRQRAEVLAAAPTGVTRVDNNLVLPGSPATAAAPATAPVSQ